MADVSIAEVLAAHQRLLDAIAANDFKTYEVWIVEEAHRLRLSLRNSLSLPGPILTLCRAYVTPASVALSQKATVTW